MFKKLFKKLQEKSRKSKYELFLKTFKPTHKTKVLDLGCGEGTFLEQLYPYKHRITGLDISDHNISRFKRIHPGIKIEKGDAKDLKFKDKSFDIVFSNAVIEHVGNFDEQFKYANEVKRVGKKYFITTPNKWFPFEPHYRLPLFQFIPKSIQRILAKHFSIGNYEKGGWEDINLLSTMQLRKLFPEAIVIKQRVTLLPETLIVIGPVE